MASPKTLRAVIIGGTGATGRRLIGEICSSPVFSEVVSLGRRETTIEEAFLRPGADINKLKQVVVDFDLEKFTLENCGSYFEGKDVLFCTIGISNVEARRMPGNTKENTKRIDLHLVVRCAEIAKATGVRHVSMMSTRGADETSWTFYFKMKGQADKTVSELGFDRVSIWRVGILERGPDARFYEKVLRLFMRSVRVEDVARAMKYDAEQFAFGKAELPPVSIYEDPEIWDFVKKSNEPEAKAEDTPSEPVAAAGNGEVGENAEKQGAEKTVAEDSAGKKEDPATEPTKEERDPNGATEGGNEAKED